jgi:hypothetical protein
MWHVENKTPFAAGRTWLRDGEGAEVWVVALKATYECLPNGSTRVAAVQVPVNTGTVLHDDGVSPLHETDLGPSKQATDVWLAGHAWSQDGKATRLLDVGFEVGPVKRQVRVHGDRQWEGGLLRNYSGETTPFVKMPLTWARAYGGGGSDCATGNPVGCGIRPREDGSHSMPNLEKPGHASGNLLVSHPAQGVGPMLRHWPHRNKYAGSHDAQWVRERAPLPPLDVQPEHWQVAPQEQQVPGRIQGGERVMLKNLTIPGFAPNGYYETRIPKLSLAWTTRFYDGSQQSSGSAVHNVILLPDGEKGSGPLICVVHHMTLPCHARVNQLDTTTVTEQLQESAT